MYIRVEDVHGEVNVSIFFFYCVVLNTRGQLFRHLSIDVSGRILTIPNKQQAFVDIGQLAGNQCLLYKPTGIVLSLL